MGPKREIKLMKNSPQEKVARLVGLVWHKRRSLLTQSSSRLTQSSSLLTQSSSLLTPSRCVLSWLGDCRQMCVYVCLCACAYACVSRCLCAYVCVWRYVCVYLLQSVCVCVNVRGRSYTSSSRVTYLKNVGFVRDFLGLFRQVVGLFRQVVGLVGRSLSAIFSLFRRVSVFLTCMCLCVSSVFLTSCVSVFRVCFWLTCWEFLIPRGV